MSLTIVSKIIKYLEISLMKEIKYLSKSEGPKYLRKFVNNVGDTYTLFIQ
jgi:hypothetical protein